MGTGLTTSFDNLKIAIKGMPANIITGLNNSLISVKEKMNTINASVGDIKSGVVNGFNDLKAGVSTEISNVKLNFNAGVENLKSKITTLENGITTKIIEFDNKIDTSITGFKTSVDEKINGVSDGITSLPSKFADLFKISDDFYTENILSLNTKLQSRLNTDSYITAFGQIGQVEAETPNIKVIINGQECTIVNFSVFDNYKSQFHNFVRGGMFIFLILYNYNSVYMLIRGRTLTDSTGHLNNAIGTQSQANSYIN